MRKITLYTAVALIGLISFCSCKKSIDETPLKSDLNVNAASANSTNNGVTPYKFERINTHNFYSQGWKEQQVNIVSGVTIFATESDYVQVVCGPENTTDRRLIPGCVTMNLPTGADPTLRRIRLRKGGYSGTRLADLTELKYSTYVVQNAPTNMVLQIDVNGDDVREFNIFYEPRENDNGQPFALNSWQQWDALAGKWHIEVAGISIPEPLTHPSTINQILEVFPNARIIDTPPVGHNGEGVRFTIGGTPRSLFDNTIGYFDALIIGTKNEQHSTFFDFTCSQGNESQGG